MVKAVLISIQPKWCELIAAGKKTIEVRKTKPSIPTPFKCYIYCPQSESSVIGNSELYLFDSTNLFNEMLNESTQKEFEYEIKPHKCNDKVIGEFVCDGVDRMAHCGTNNNDISLELVDELLYCIPIDSTYLNKCKLSYMDIVEYESHKDVYAWHISDLVIYDKPKELSEFGLKRPPKSWCYVEEVQ